jgi:hypothetical protein
MRVLHARCRRELRRVQQLVGVSESQLRALEKAKVARFQKPDTEKKLWRSEIEYVHGSHDLDELAATGLTQLLRLVPAAWLRTEAQKIHRLDATFLTPLHLVNGYRVGYGPMHDGPQRFARMLLVTQDHLNKRWDLDFFSAALLVPEVAVLGNSLNEIRALGPEAERKLAALHRMSDDEVSATVYELLVGAACVRMGRSITMVADSPANSSGAVYAFHTYRNWSSAAVATN